MLKIIVIEESYVVLIILFVVFVFVIGIYTVRINESKRDIKKNNKNKLN